MIVHEPDPAELTLSEIKQKQDNRELTAAETVDAFRKRYESDCSHQTPVNGYIEFYEDAGEQAERCDNLRKSGDTRPLLGLPLAVKDNIHIEGKPVTCASKILEGYRAPYTATVISRLAAAGAVFMGRTNMDEFAMGSSCEYSCYGATRNPIDRDRIAGGSSGGSAAVVAARQAPFALGSDTGGSVRLPASYCGVYGLKPGYGVLSRYGLVAFGSSLDQIGFLARSPADMALVLEIAAGKDQHDSTSEETDFSGVSPLAEIDLTGLTVGVPRELTGEAIEGDVKTVYKAFCTWLEDSGARVEQFSLPILDTCVAIYYIIALAEASSNLSRYDGVKYGFRIEDWRNLLDMYERTRERGFGPEVKRRILIGNYVLSSGYYDAYYKKAQAVRSLLKIELLNAFKKYQCIVSPTSPTVPFRLGEKIDDPLSMYMTDICTTSANLTSIPALSIPAGETADGLPVGVQLMGPKNSEKTLLQIADSWHRREPPG